MLLWWSLLLLAGWGGPPTAAASIVQGTPTVVNAYPDAFTVHVPLRSEGAAIVAARGYLQVGFSTVRQRVNIALTPGPDAVATWTWKTRGRTVSPYTPITLTLQARTADSPWITLPALALVYEDNRFPWRERRSAHVVVRWYAGDDAFGETILALAEATVARVSADVALRVPRPLVMLVYASQEDFFSWHAVRTEWVGGQAFPDLGVAAEIIPPDSPRRWLREVVPHEMTHLLLAQAMKSPIGEPPAWLVEGLAQHYEVAPADLDRIHAALREEGALPLGIMRSPPGQRAEEARRWYDQARSMTEYLLRRHGKQALARYMALLRSGTAPTRAFVKAFGEEEAAFYTAWRRYLGLPVAPPSPASPLASTSPTPVPAPGVTGTASRSTIGAILVGTGVVLLVVTLVWWTTQARRRDRWTTPSRR